jgi:hypothetical protein
LPRRNSSRIAVSALSGSRTLLRNRSGRGGLPLLSPAPPENRVKEQQVLLEHCGDQTWKEQNLGLWYSVCRPTMRW